MSYHESSKMSQINGKPRKDKHKAFAVPTVEDVRLYCVERKNLVDAEKFVDYCEARGWMLNKSIMKSWEAAVRTWENNGFSNRMAEQPTAKVKMAYDQPVL